MNKDEVSEMHRTLNSWRKVGAKLGIPARTAWRYAKTDYVPRREDLREALGLDPKTTVAYIRQERNPKGEFIKQRGDSTNE